MRSCKCYDCRDGRERREEIRRGGVTDEVMPHRGPGKSKKNTKQWCRGKVGRVHVYVRIEQPWCYIDMCELCGKRGKYYWKPW